MDGVKIRIAELAPAEFRQNAKEALDVYVAAMGYSPRVTWQRSPLWHEHSTWAGFSAVAAFAAAEEASTVLPDHGRSSNAASPGRGFARRIFHPRRDSPSAVSPALSPGTDAGSDGHARAAAPHDRIDLEFAGPEDGHHATAAGDDRLVGICYGYAATRGQWWFDHVARGAERAGVVLPEPCAELTELHVHPALHGHGIGANLLDAFLATRSEPSVLLSTPEAAGEANNAWRLYRRRGFTDVLRDFVFDGDPRLFGILALDLGGTARRADTAPHEEAG